MSNSNGIILLVSGPISVISSTIIILMVLRSRKKLSHIYHRLMFGISVTDIIFSSGLSFSSLPAPIGTPDTWKALGNRSTCNAQGCFIMFGSAAAPAYFLSLQIYYLCKIKYQMSSEKMRKVEPCLHGVPILLGLTAAIVPLVTDSMNPGTRGYCWLQDYPLHCITDQSVECIRGMTMTIQRPILLVIPLLLNSVLSGIIMWMIYASVRKQDSRNGLYSFELNSPCRQGTSRPRRRASFIRSQDEILTAQYQKSRKARQRIMQYFVAYVLMSLFPILDAMLYKVQSMDNLLQILVMTFYPLWGFYNLVVFILPAVKKVQERNVDFSLPRACVTAIISYIGPSSVDSRTRKQYSIIPRTSRKLKFTDECVVVTNSSHDIESNTG